MNIFVEIKKKKLWVIRVIKRKQDLFWRIAEIIFQILRKTFQKQNFRQTSFDLGQLELQEVSRTLENWAQFGSNLHDKYSVVFYKDIQWQYLEYEL